MLAFEYHYELILSFIALYKLILNHFQGDGIKCHRLLLSDHCLRGKMNGVDKAKQVLFVSVAIAWGIAWGKWWSDTSDVIPV